MYCGAFKVAVASALFFLIHSALANDQVKAVAAEWFGQREVDAFYRPLYLVQALVLLTLLVIFVRRQPGRDLYRVTGVWVLVLRAGQAAGAGVLLWAALTVGIHHLTGSSNVAAWFQGADVPRMPDGQEPSPAADGSMRMDGPLGYTRHPLNWSLFLLFWLQPRMTTRLLAFNLVMTVYLVLGSLHAEAHMLAFYGDAYRDYQLRVPFFLTSP